MKRLLTVLIALLSCLAAPAQDFIVWPGIVEETATGHRTQTGSKNALCVALVACPPGGTIEVNGALPHVDLALGPGYRKNEAVRDVPFDVTLVGGQDASVRGFSISAAGGGVAYLHIKGLAIDARGSQVGVLGYMDTRLGTLVFEDVDLLSDSKTKWGFRIHGWAEDISFIGVRGWDGGQEHLAYVDATRKGVHVDGVVGSHWRRTLVQVVCREQPGSPGILRPAPSGNVSIENCRAYDCGADGAFNYTVAGWPAGQVRFAGNYGESKYETGLFVCYYDQKQGGLVTADGYATAHVIWSHNVGIFPNGVREVNGIGSVGLLEVRVGDINSAFNYSPNRGMNLAMNGKACGEVQLQSRVDPNTWNWQSPKMFLLGKTVLTPDEVRALWVH